MQNEIMVKEYLGNKIEFKMINGEVYANATSFNEPQKLKDWKRSNKTKELIEELSKVENSHITKELIFSERGQGENSGTWIHETLVLDFAQYISVRLRVWVQQQIATLIREGSVSIKPKTEEEILANLTLSVYKGGQEALLAAKELTEIEVAKATKPLIETIEVQKPKVEFADKLLKSKDNILVREYAKILQDENVNIGEKKLYKWLRENKYLMRNNEPYQSYMKYFVVIENSIDTPFGIKLVKTTKINPNGQLFFYNKLKNEF